MFAQVLSRSRVWLFLMVQTRLWRWVSVVVASVAMPRVTVQRGGLQVHCTPSQVETVASSLLSSVERPALAFAASEISKFVEETHSFVAKRSDECVLSDLRHAALWLRSHILAMGLDKACTNRRLETVKALGRLHTAYAELRHFDGSRLRALAKSTAGLVEEIGGRQVDFADVFSGSDSASRWSDGPPCFDIAPDK